MALETEQTPTPESSDAAGQTLGAEQGENQQATATTEMSPSPEGQEGQTPEDAPEWNGDISALPEKWRPRAKGMLQHMHKVTQEAANAKRDAEKILQDPAYQEFVKSRQAQPANQPPATPEAFAPTVTPDEVALAASGDPTAFQQVVYKSIAPAAQQFEQRLYQMEQKLAMKDAEMELNAVASANKDFYEIPLDIMKAAAQETVLAGKGTWQDAYNRAKQIEKTYLDVLNARNKAEIEKKKKAVTASPSSSHTPQVIEVADIAEWKRVTTEMALQGKVVDVRVRKAGKK